MSINGQLGLEDVAYNGVVLRHKNNERLPSAAKRMDLENIMLGEMSDKEKYYIISLICRIKKIIQIKVYAKRKRLTDIENKLVITKREKEGERKKSGVWNEEIQITMYKIDKQKGYTVYQREFYPLSYSNL